jgi:hypothetical protein
MYHLCSCQWSPVPGGDISKAIADPVYIHRWKKEKSYATHLCSVSECSAKNFASLTTHSTRDETEQACDTLGLK